MEMRAILLATVALLPCACSSEPSTSAADPVEPDRIDVVAAFYPLQFVTERVGGDAVSVTNLTPAGAEPQTHPVPAGPRGGAPGGRVAAVGRPSRNRATTLSDPTWTETRLS